ncbi:MAG: response regulator [Gallionella sp.]
MNKNIEHTHIGSPLVFVVDDDEAMRHSIVCLLESANLPCRMFGDAGAFLEFCDPRQSGCLLLDIRMPGMGGMELLERLQADGVSMPVIIITGHGDVPLAVRALKSGAFDFVQKPFHAQDLLDKVHAALKQVRELRHENLKQDSLRSRFDVLTGREREIMEFVVSGGTSKVIAIKLGISPKTVDIHRSNIMKKLNVQTIAELVQNRLALRDDY